MGSESARLKIDPCFMVMSKTHKKRAQKADQKYLLLLYLEVEQVGGILGCYFLCFIY